jgi:hypothetical protein
MMSPYCNSLPQRPQPNNRFMPSEGRFRVNNGPDGLKTRLPVYPGKRTSADRPAWSVSCQNRKSRGLFDHLIGAGEHSLRNNKAERFGGLEVDDQLDFRNLDNRQISRLCPP